MSARVLLRPGNQAFLVAGSETLLEAGLRAGLAMNYGCSGGNCGLCRARVLSGQVRKTRPYDYVFSPAEKSQGYVLLCSHTALTDLELEANLAARPEDIPEQDIVARVKEIKPLTDKVRLLHLQTPRSNRLRFLAGQAVTLSAVDDAGEYAIASCPCDDRNLQFHIRRVPADAFAERVFNGMKPGDAVAVRGPHGDFVLRQDSTRPLLLLACNSGFAPVKSLVEHAVSLETAESLHLYWLATVNDGHYMANWCRAWADALENFHYTELVADSLRDPTPDQILQTVLRDHPDVSRFDAYVAGPESFVTPARGALLQAGMPVAQVRTMVA
jgi:CDP-4-dehydro-6-deoxyglucose reductase